MGGGRGCHELFLSSGPPMEPSGSDFTAPRLQVKINPAHLPSQEREFSPVYFSSCADYPNRHTAFIIELWRCYMVGLSFAKSQASSVNRTAVSVLIWPNPLLTGASRLNGQTWELYHGGVFFFPKQQLFCPLVVVESLTNTSFLM